MTINANCYLDTSLPLYGDDSCEDDDEEAASVPRLSFTGGGGGQQEGGGEGGVNHRPMAVTSRTPGDQDS